MLKPVRVPEIPEAEQTLTYPHDYYRYINE